MRKCFNLIGKWQLKCKDQLKECFSSCFVEGDLPLYSSSSASDYWNANWVRKAESEYMQERFYNALFHCVYNEPDVGATF